MPNLEATAVISGSGTSLMMTRCNGGIRANPSGWRVGFLENTRYELNLSDQMGGRIEMETQILLLGRSAFSNDEFRCCARKALRFLCHSLFLCFVLIRVNSWIVLSKPGQQTIHELTRITRSTPRDAIERGVSTGSFRAKRRSGAVEAGVGE